jgi:ANTAR domain
VVSTGMAALLAALSGAARQDLAAVPARWCAEILEVSGIAASVLAADGSSEDVWRTEGASTALEDLQFTLGEGPGIDAAASGELILEPDLSAVPPDRWPVFAPAALNLGVRAVFAVPLQIGAIRVGVLLAQRGTPGLLTKGNLADLLLFARTVVDVLLGPAADGSASLVLGGQQSKYRAEVHQATGMVSVQLGVSPADALIRMRAYAFSQNVGVSEVAADVVARKLRFDNKAS